MTKPTKMIVAVVPGFDPNRPDLQEFLSSLAAQALTEEHEAPRTSRTAKRKPRKNRSARGGGRRRP